MKTYNPLSAFMVSCISKNNDWHNFWLVNPEPEFPEEFESGFLMDPPSYNLDNIFAAVLFGLFLRWSTSLSSYSGMGKPPLYGDYEAQRHWMEITYNLPMEEWYFNTEKNDLQYWGLDYPPLTAYHSLLMGHVANYVNPEYVALNTSRGYESPDHKLFMRYSTLISDVATYVLAVILYSFSGTNSSRSHFSILLDVYVLLTYPGLILIDYGHFQYNCVSLGLSLMSFTATGSRYDLLSAVLFCLSISYKQMLLYFSLPFFFYHLGKCHQRGFPKGFIRLVTLSVVVISIFAVTWYPVARNYQQFLQVIHRIFPIYRGVFEDKVSNIWCLLNIFFKFRLYFSNDTIAIVCAVLTFTTCLPSCIHLFYRPRKQNLNLCLIISSLSFFLCSYQVHEKTILIVALPIMLYFQKESFHCLWFLLVSSCSMFPLLIKDGLVLPFIGLNLIFITSINIFYSFTDYEFIPKNDQYKHTVYYIFQFTLGLWAALLAASCIVSPPASYPDLFPLLISCYSALHFIYFFIYFNYIQLFKGKTKQV